jgi:hypothetical protein
MTVRIHNSKSGGIDYILFSEDPSQELEFVLDGSLRSHWSMTKVPSVETLKQLSAGFYNGLPLTRNAGSPHHHEGWIVTVVADQPIQALYQAADCETKRAQIESEFLIVARRITSLLEKEGVTTRRGHQAELLSIGKLERITRDGRPMLHFHAYVFNFGRSVESGEFGALSFKKAFDLQRYYQNILTKDFANRLITKLHFDVYRRRDNGLGIRGVTNRWIAAWKADSNPRLKAFKNTVGVRRQKLIDQFNRYSRLAKQQWNLEERLATWRQQGEKFGWYLRNLPTRTFRYLSVKQVERLSTRYVKRAIRWESNHANLVCPKTLVASALVESLRDERVNEETIKQAITKMMTNPRKYGLDTWKVKNTEYVILLRNSQLMRQAIQRSATMSMKHHRRHKIDKKELAHQALYLDKANTVTLNQFATGEYLTFVPADKKQALGAILKSYASRKYRTIIISKSARLRPKDVDGEFVTVANFIKKTQPKKFAEIFWRVRQHRLRGIRHAAQMMDAIRKPDWKLKARTSVLIDPSNCKAAELKVMMDYLHRKRCKVIMLSDNPIAMQMQHEMKQQQQMSMKMGMKL